MEPAPGNQTSEWRATLLALLALPGFGAALAIFKEALLARPWPFVALAGIGAAVAAVYVVCRTWLKGRGVATVAAVLVLLLAAPARADGPQLRAPLPADVPVAEAAPAPPPAPPEPPTLTLSGFAACSAKAAADCLANPTAPPADARAFYTSLLGSIGPALTTIGAVLWLKLDPTPLGK